MNRRELLRSSAAGLAISALSRRLPAQTTPAPVPQQGTPAPGRKPSGRFPLDVYSRDLQWLRTPPEVATAVIDIGLRSIDLTVTPYPGHVDPTKVKTDLPTFVRGLKECGISVSAITCPITDVESPNAEAIIATASAEGIRHYSWGSFVYDETKPYPQQLDVLKPRIAGVVKLNEKYGIKALYQPRPLSNDIGAAFFDLFEVLRNFDPRFVGFRYDTSLGLTTQNLLTQLRLGGPYIGGIALNDAVVKLELPVWHEGEFAGSPQSVAGQGAGGDNTGRTGGNFLALGGGGRPLPYRFHTVPAGTGMVDLIAVGKALKEIQFSGPAECQTDWPLGGAEEGKDQITAPRLRVLGQIKHNRLTVEAAFAKSWDLDVLLPPYMQPGGPLAPGRRGVGPYWPQ